MSNGPRHRIQPELLAKSRELRRGAVMPERILWSYLRDRRLDGLKFRRQTPLAPFVADFVCHEAQLVVELDGMSHDNRIDYDRSRDAKLTRDGYRVVRFMNEDVLQDVAAVLRTILRECGRSPD